MSPKITKRSNRKTQRMPDVFVSTVESRQSPSSGTKLNTTALFSESTNDSRDLLPSTMLCSSSDSLQSPHTVSSSRSRRQRQTPLQQHMSHLLGTVLETVASELPLVSDNARVRVSEPLKLQIRGDCGDLQKRLGKFRWSSEEIPLWSHSTSSNSSSSLVKRSSNNASWKRKEALTISPKTTTIQSSEWKLPVTVHESLDLSPTKPKRKSIGLKKQQSADELGTRKMTNERKVLDTVHRHTSDSILVRPERRGSTELIMGDVLAQLALACEDEFNDLDS